jgi:hypothetical protein
MTRLRSTMLLVGLLCLAAFAGYMGRSPHDSPPMEEFVAVSAANDTPCTVPLGEVTTFFSRGPDSGVTHVGFYRDGVYGEAQVVAIENGTVTCRGWRPIVRTVRRTAISQG